MHTTKLRWGILGAANIARKNWKAILNSGNGVVTAVASRDLDRSARFVKECQAEAAFPVAPRPLGAYEELLNSPEVDAVYIPLPTGVRAEWVERAAAAGKHVLCEKPCAVSVVELSRMLEACRGNNVQFMDGVMFMHSQRLELMRRTIDDGKTLGALRRIASAFSFRAEDEFFNTNIRAYSDLEPHGCVGDLGWYCIRLSLWAMNWRLPLRVTGRTLSFQKHPDSWAPVTTEFSGELFFPDGVTAGFYCSFVTGDEQWAVLTGTQGHLRIPDFVLPFTGSEVAFETGNPVFDVRGCDFEMQPHLRRWAVQESSHGQPSAQEARMFRNFAGQVLSGVRNSEWPHMALQTQVVMEACLLSASEDARVVEVCAPEGA